MPQLVYVMETDSPDNIPPGAILAYFDPSFIIKTGSTYWKTVAVAGYNISEAGDDVDEIQGVNEVTARFIAAWQAADVYAAVPDTAVDIVFTIDDSTKPHHSNQSQ
jgi:hypothetical protein